MRSSLPLALTLILLLSVALGETDVSRAASSAWSGGIAINEDGSFTPVDAPIQHVGNLYRLTRDILGSIYVYADNIVVDGSGHMIQGYGNGTGINAEDYQGVELSFEIKNTTFSNLEYGIFFVNMNNCRITGNIFRDCSIGICLGWPDWHYGGGSGHIVENNSISSCGTGIFTQSSKVTVSRNVIMNNLVGVSGTVDYGSQFLYNQIINNTEAGIELWGCYDNRITGNNISSNGDGIVLRSTCWYSFVWSGNSIISMNSIESNKGNGIELVSSSYNTITGNTIRKNDGNGTRLEFWNFTAECEAATEDCYCWNNIVAENDIIDNKQYGLSLHTESISIFSTSNKIYHNNFVENTLGQALAGGVVATEATDSFDDSYPSGGNYWSDYVAADANQDGIGDTAYVINDQFRDRYPFMNPWEQTIYFKDGFESGSFNAWNGTRTTSGETASVVDTMQHHGVYSARFSSSGGGGYENSYSIAKVNADKLYARADFYLSQSGVSIDGDRVYFIVFRASGNVAYAGLRRINGEIKWCLTLRDGTSYVDVYSVSSDPAPTASRWYVVELHWVKDASHGLAEMWVDNKLVCCSYNKDTSAYGNVGEARLGLAEVRAGSTIVYCDCAEVSNRYIGTKDDRVLCSLSISASDTSTTWKLGAVISGSLEPARSGLEIPIKCGSDSEWTTLATVRTDAEGKYAYKWVPTNASSNVWIYELMASWEGDDLALGADSSVITLTFMPVATSISIATSSSSTILGYAINASGRLVDEYGDPLRNEEVFLSCGNLEGVSTVSRMTDESGCFLVTWIPIRPGSFMVKAEWMGNTTFDSSNINATVCSIAYGQHIFSVESNSSTSQLSFNETDQSLRFTASGPDGTNGYARVTVAKEFITDPLMVRVSIDDANEDFSVLSTDDSWILAFDYSHSAHFVVVDLDIMAVPEFQQFMVLPLFLTGSLLATLLSRRRRD